ncbi:efflux RND transporter periplasmic adaptor subunit [Pseudoduganella sp.]|uniref:efflux RND transporter periplasmic adaptor subunit n=1 Tax=Pseudoduganella sp. TaxID=1880898 RepID=UPI0035AFC5DE
MPEPVRPSLRWRLALAVALLAGLAALAWWQWGPIPVTLAAIERGPAVDAIYATGTVEPTVMLPLAPRVGGRLAERTVDEGAHVRKGQLLARLDDADLAGSVDEQRARVDYSRNQHARAATLAERGFLSSGEADRTKAELLAAEAALRRVRAQRDYMALLAPADGTIIRRDGEVGQYISPGQAIFVLACCAPLRVTAEIDEEDISRVRVGQAVVLKADALPGQVFDGSVAEITPKGDPVARTYRVRIALAAPGALQTGMTVDANLVVARREHAMLLPAAALQGDSVWVVGQDGRLQRRSIVPGVRSAQRVEVLQGLQGNERVVAQPGAQLAEGRRARVHAAAPAATPATAAAR